MSKKKIPVQFYLPIGGGLVNECCYVDEDELIEKDEAAELQTLLDKAEAGQLSARALSLRRDELLREAVRCDRVEALLRLLPKRRMEPMRFAALLAFAESCQSPDAAACLLAYRHAHYRPDEFDALEQRQLDLELGLTEPVEKDYRKLFRLRYVKQGVCVCGVKAAQRAYEIPAAIGGKPVVGVDGAAFYGAEPLPRVRREFGAPAAPQRAGEDTILFGRTMEKRGSAERPLRWRVLRREEGRALLLCERAVAVLPYHPELLEVTWESCALRHWLNEIFLPLAFSAEEQARILPTAVVTPDNGNFGTSGGPATEDRLFLLSAEEATSLGSADALCAIGCWWWLRTPGFDNGFAATVTPEGAVVRIGSFVDTDDYGVRPALWLKINEGD